MSSKVFPTKNNLIATKKSLELAKLGYDLMDRKRNILIREIMTMSEKASTIQSEIIRHMPRRITLLSRRRYQSATVPPLPNVFPLITVCT